MRIDTVSGKRIGYVHIYSYAGNRFHDALVESLLWGPLNDADGAVIDLRFGLGGADPSYLNLFNRSVPTITATSRDGTESVYDPQWRKPVAFLVDRTSRSGKEIIAYGARDTSSPWSSMIPRRAKSSQTPVRSLQQGYCSFWP